MLSLILGLVTGLAGPITGLVGKIVDLKAAKANAASDKERALIDQQIQETEAKKAILVAEAGHRVSAAINSAFRATLFAIPVGLIVWKLLVWDKVIGSMRGCVGSIANTLEHCITHNTDPLSTTDIAMITAVLSFYLLTQFASRK